MGGPDLLQVMPGPVRAAKPAWQAVRL